VKKISSSVDIFWSIVVDYWTITVWLS